MGDLKNWEKGASLEDRGGSLGGFFLARHVKKGIDKVGRGDGVVIPVSEATTDGDGFRGDCADEIRVSLASGAFSITEREPLFQPRL